MLNPRTPTKADDGIPQLKQSLSAKWGIELPFRDPAWSPSHRNPSLVEEKIATSIQFLYFRAGALRHAIEQFERHAFTLCSEWQFKPYAEVDVLPARERRESALRKDFLHKRNQLKVHEVDKLKEVLWHQLSEVVDRVKEGKKFSVPTLENSRPIFCPENLPEEDNSRDNRPSLAKGVRDTSELNAMAVSSHASSDDFKDDDMVEFLNEATWAPTLTSREEDTKWTAQTSPIDDKFETPPSTPPHCAKTRLENDAPGSGLPDSIDHIDPELVPVVNRKRSFGDCMEPPPPCKSSRETRSHYTGYSHDSLAPATKRSDKSFTDFGDPIPSHNEKIWSTFSRTRSHSSMNFASVSSSMKSASSAMTSPNTSFCNSSLATSFSSHTDETDTTIHSRIADPPLTGNSTLRSAPHTAAQDEIGHVQEHVGAKSALDDMDVDSEPTVTYPTAIGSDVDVNFKRPDGVESNPNSGNDVERLLAERLLSHSPFATQSIENYSALPFRQLYEITRISGYCKIDSSLFSSCATPIESYEELWSTLSKVAKAHGKSMPERSSLTAWHRAGLDFDKVALTGTLKLLNERKGPVFSFALNPLSVEPYSYRLSRQFGSDRFCVLGMPGLGPESLPSYLRSHAVVARATVIKWLIDTEHQFLGRTWRAFYTNPIRSKSLKSDKPKFRVYFFAENGTGFRQAQLNGESDPRVLERPQMNVRELLQWFMPTRLNGSQSALKFFARLALAVSSTVSTVEFTPSEIFRSDDARANAPCQRRLDYRRSDQKKIHVKPSVSTSAVMNDGCARISRKAALGIAESLGLDSVPCCFQGRIGGAKGMWMIDVLDERPSAHGRNYWIEITDSQLKFEGHSTDAMYPVPARVTFEVNDFPKRLSPGSLSFQLLPILVDRKVPADVFIDLLEKDLTARSAELEVAMDSGCTLRKWTQANFPVTEERARYGGIEMQGGLPLSRAEKINWFVEHGFEPKRCRYLKDQLFKAIMAYCLRLEKKMKIGLAESTNAFMIADPLGVLEENEVHIAFSTAFKDQTTSLDQTMLHDIDVLVARSPAHLPSDIQKVRAVFKPELRLYRDVVVFPSKGPVALASKLSGGDYDGDKAWICWDPNIVKPFENADVPEHPKIEFYGIEKDRTTVADFSPYQDYTSRFLRHAFEFNLQSNMLGICTQYHEAYCYRFGAIGNPQAMSVGMLLGDLVDSAKGGFKFDEAKWAAFKQKNKLPMTLPKPAYKDKNNQRPTKHLIDRLVFVTAKNTREAVLKKFSEHFNDVDARDTDLFRLRNEAYEEAKNNGDLAEVLANLMVGIRKINTYWRKHVRVDQDDDDTRPSTTRPDAPSFRTVVERCREDFLHLYPELAALPTSDKIAGWQHDHSAGRASHWDLLKASVAFHAYFSSTFIWHVAGVELGEIKAMARGRGTYRIVTSELFESFKLDPKVVDAARGRMLDVAAGGSGEIEDDFDDFGDFEDF